MVHNVSPSLKSDTLEHCQHRKAEVVKVGDSEVGPVPAVPTLVLVTELRAVETVVDIARVRAFHDLIYKIYEEMLNGINFEEKANIRINFEGKYK